MVYNSNIALYYALKESNNMRMINQGAYPYQA